MTQSGTDKGSGRSDLPEPLPRCAWCRRPLTVRSGPGRPRRFCQQSCRQRDYEARRRARELDLGDHQLIVARHALDALRDELYVLACAVEDVERDLAATARPTTRDLQDALTWLLDAARPLCSATSDLGADRP
ncbi:MAG TPA: hypothetical protein VF076_09995 [Acidimicrobiales bacterium]